MPRLRSSSSYSNYHPKSLNGDDYAARQHKPFIVFLLVVTVTAIIFVVSAVSILVYFRIRHGPLKLGSESDDCTGHQVWNDCGYACKLTCDKQYTLCAAVCSPGCECPSQIPIWHNEQCIKRQHCPAGETNVTAKVIMVETDKNIINVATEAPNRDWRTTAQPSSTTQPGNPPDSESLHQGSKSGKFTEFIQGIWSKDQHKFSASELMVNIQGKNNVSSARDMAPERLFPNTDSTLFTEKGDIYTSFIELLDCYNKNMRQADAMSARKTHHIHKFLDAVLEQDIMKETQQFLEKQGFVNKISFRQTLYELWFEQYPRSPRYNITDSSGFEHVFVGEVRGRKISGLHSWVQFYMLENNSGLDYYGYIQSIYLPHNNQLIAVNVKYIWESQRRKQGSFLIGASPEFELAMYTTCFILYPNRLCEFEIDGATIDVSTYDVKHVPGWQILTAYPIV